MTRGKWIRPNIKEKFWTLFDFSVSECWEWTGQLTEKGYGVLGRKRHKAHRLSYEFYNGEIPKGMVICHTCDNRKCVNPHHLWCGTQQDNLKDMRTKNRDNSFNRKKVKPHV